MKSTISQLMKKNFKLICSILFSQTIFFCAQAQNTTPIPLPEDVRHGVLPNKMQYFIMKNEEPKNKVSFYFAQKVGAILEEDDEDGLAHFLEHMAFNGSKNFKGREMTQYLETKGLLFGRDINAYTDVDETLYNIDDADATDEELIDKCLLMLHDWSGYLLLEEKEIDNERGVIEEEWRSRRGPGMRLLEKKIPVLYANSKYAKRDIIGDQKFIQTFKYQSLRNYYKKWYRPDLQAVVVVGDIDVDRMEQKVIQHFSEIPLPKNAKERTYFNVPENTETTYLLATDAEATESVIQWNIKEKSAQIKDSTYLRNDLVKTLFTYLVNTRYGEILLMPDAKGIDYYTNYGNLNLSSKMLSLEIRPKEGMELQAFEEAYTEMVKIMRYGFTDTELERATKAFLLNAEQAIENESKISNRAWGPLLSSYFLQGNPIMKATNYYDFLTQALATIKVDEVSMLAKKFLRIQNSLFIVTGKEKENHNYPSKDELLGVLDKVNAMEVNAYVDVVDNAPLVEEDLPIVPIAKEFDLVSMPEAKGYELDNGAKVILIPSQKEGEDITLIGVSKGGYSKVSLTDLPSAKMATETASLSGLGKFNAAALTKKLTGKVANVNTSIGEYEEYITGRTTITDFETFLQLVYLNFTEPKFDEALFESNLKNSKADLARSKDNTENVYLDSLLLATNGYNPRQPIITASYLDQIDFAVSKRIFKQRFANANDFTFVFSGNFKGEKTLESIKRYLGNLPFDKSVDEDWTDFDFGPKKGETKIHFARLMSNPQTSITYQLSFPKEYSSKDNAMMQLIAGILSTRYNDTIREEEGGSYGVGVYSRVQNEPDAAYILNIQFECNPDKDAKLLQIVKDEVHTLAEKGPSVAYLEKVKSNMIKDRQQAMQDDPFWTQAVVNEMLYGQHPLTMEAFEQMLTAVTVKDIKKYVSQNLVGANKVEVVMSPKK